MGRTQRSRWLGWMLVPVLAMAGLTGVARGSMPDDPNNLQQWVARYNGPANSEDDARSLAMAPDGSKVFVTGRSRGPGSWFDATYDYATIAYSTATGAELWVTGYNGPANHHDVALSLAVAPDGSKVFVTGASVGSGGSSDYATIAYSTATGAELWVTRYNGPGNGGDEALALAVAPDGSKVFVTGNDIGSGSASDYLTVAYSTATGAELWVARYDGPANAYDRASSLAVTPDGSKVFVTGYSPGVGSDYATVAYSTATGAELWATRYNGPGDSSDSAASLAVAPDGSKVFVTGQSYGSGSSFDYATIAYSTATGAELWVARYNGPANFFDVATSLAVAPDGSKVFVAGYRYSYGSDSSDDYATADYATVAYSTVTGAELWVARYDGPENSDDFTRSLAVAPDGSKVFVTGYSHGSGSSFDYATVAYSTATGAEFWAARYNGPANSYDYVQSFAVAPDGSKVFVTGYSRSAGGDLDFATVAYSTASDTTPPILSLPADITANATSPAGAVVSYSATASDDDGANPAVVCDPPSGSTFAIGTTTVNCSTSDAAGNVANGSFHITVKGASEQIPDLAARVQSMNLPFGTQSSLLAKLRAAQAYLRAGDVANACSSLKAFINEVRAQSGKALTPAQASELTTEGNRIRAVLSC